MDRPPDSRCWLWLRAGRETLKNTRDLLASAFAAGATVTAMGLPVTGLAPIYVVYMLILMVVDITAKIESVGALRFPPFASYVCTSRLIGVLPVLNSCRLVGCSAGTCARTLHLHLHPCTGCCCCPQISPASWTAAP